MITMKNDDYMNNTNTKCWSLILSKDRTQKKIKKDKISELVVHWSVL